MAGLPTSEGALEEVGERGGAVGHVRRLDRERGEHVHQR